VTAEQFAAPSNHSWGSLRGTLVHTLDTEYGWRLLIQEGKDSEVFEEADFPTLESIVTRWREEEANMRNYLASLRDEDMARAVSYDVSGGTRQRVLWHTLFHVVNHGMQHRGEAAHLLTQYGQSPGELDFTRWLAERQL
jgi:uncharacterized damage-inducible protein DinB